METTTDLTSVAAKMLPRGLPGRASALAARALGLRDIEAAYSVLKSQADARPIAARLLDHLKITYTVAERDLAQIPRKGAALVLVNHPFGILEGAVLATALLRVRSDVRILANGILTAIPELQDLLIPVDPASSDVATNFGGMRKAIEFLRGGGLLIVFPAGEVSHFQWRERAISDPQWNSSVARMISITVRRGTAVSVVPAFVEGANGLVFQTAGLIHPGIRTALLARELLNKKGSRVDLRIGAPITSEKLLAIATDVERVQYLRWRTYLLANRNQFKPNTSLPLAAPKPRPSSFEPIAEAVNPVAMREEIALLGPEHLAKSGDLAVYLAPAALVPSVLQEIGRLREITFRTVGEGTGRAVDIDRFDAHYLHLFVWNEKKLEVAGAYRLGATDVIRRAAGVKGLYTASLFKYDDAFLAEMGPALELGRSFIRAEYQRAFTPLLLLWKGIGRYVASNPRYKVLFGPVSISNQYQSISRELMVSFLERHASVREWVGLVSNRNPFRRRTSARMQQPDVPDTVFGIDELSDVVSDLEPNRAGVPVLLRQYLRLGGRLLGFNVDPEFANALDGLILVDLTRTEPKLLDRYMGAEEAAQFLEFQRGQNGTH